MIRHEIIYASAGSGKTFRLTGRIIELLLHGVAPERIIALTFSRAAAGEIFDTVITRLAAAAADPAEAATLGRHTDHAGLRPAACCTALRTLVSRMHLSPIGTLDSFFVRVVRAFPFEFGISGEFTILDENLLALEKMRILRALLRPPASHREEEAQAALLESFKRATFGREEKRLSSLLDEYTADFYQAFLDAPDPALWGRPDAVWPDGSPWLDGPDVDPPREAAALRRALGRLADLTDKQQAKWDAFLAMAEGFTPHTPLTADGKELFLKLLAVHAALETGAAEITLYRTLTLGPAQCRPAAALVRHLMRCLLQNRLETTAGLCEVLTRFAQEYDTRLRRAGKLTFADIQFLLAGGTAEAPRPQLTRVPVAAPDRLFIDYRLDAAYEHWALDEFQDTSRLQWLAIRNLIDEVVQDDSGRRSFFAVGDVKQAIYGWRGGDSRLMREILDTYNPPGQPKTIADVPLPETRRSCQAIVDAVNRAFGTLVPGQPLPHPVVAQWQAEWTPHTTANRDTGCAVLADLPYRKGEGARAAAARRFAWVAETLVRIDPRARGLSAAVLVRANDTGRDVVEQLRAAGLVTAWGGDTPVTDNPVTGAFLALLRSAAHPADSFAWEQLLMTPLGACVLESCGGSRDTFTLDVLTDLHARGFEFTLSRWLDRLQHARPLDPFSRQRLHALLAAAQLFDATGGKRVLEFLDLARAYRVHDPPGEGSIQVMTIHRSKGLGFDLVFLPDLQGGTILSSGQLGLTVHRAGEGDRPPRWVLDLPPRDIAAAVPELQAAVEALDHDGCFGELCLLYVAMTRARRGLYLATTAPAPKSETVTLATLLRTVFALPGSGPAPGELATEHLIAGTPDWWHDVHPARPPATPATATAPAAGPTSPAPAPERQRLPRRVPSRRDGAETEAAGLFSRAGRDGRTFGTLMHGLLEQVEWLDARPVAEWLAAWRARQTALPAAALDEADTVFRAAAAQPAFAAALARPAGTATPPLLWRERSFEVVLDGQWVSGTFDRVVLCRDEAGALERAVILDYKSDRLENQAAAQAAAAGYAGQMTLYRRALALLTGLAPGRIAVRILFLRTGAVVDV